MNLVKRLVSARLDWLLIGIFVGFAVCFNSCSAISTFKGYSSLCLPLAILGCLFLVVLPDKVRGNSALSIGVLVFTVPAIFSAVGNISVMNTINSLTLLAVILLAYLCVRKVGPFRLCRLYVRLICMTSCISLAFWVASNILGINFPFPVFENVNGVHYKTILIASQYVEAYISKSNSMGFFWESGIFASYLLLAMAVELMVELSPSKARMALLVITLITTGSTAGYLLLPLVIAIFVLRKGGRGRVLIAIGLVLLVVVFFANYQLIIDMLVQINPSLFWKLDNADAVTRLTRLQSPEVCLKLFSSSPILGLGYGNALQAYSIAISGMTSIDSLTSTSFFQLAAFGVSGFLMWSVTIYGLMRTHRFSLSASIVLTFLFIIIINKEPHTASALTYILLFSFLAFSGEDNEKGVALENRGIDEK